MPTGALALLALASGAFRFEAERNHSTIGFSIGIASGMTRVTGKFTRFEASVMGDPEDPTTWSITADIEAASVDTGIEERDDDLRGPSFFHTASHPSILFESDAVDRIGGDFVARGTLSIRGVARRIELPLRVVAVDWAEEAPVLGLAAALTLNRTAFGVGNDWRHTLIPGFLAEDVQVEIFLWTKRGKKEK